MAFDFYDWKNGRRDSRFAVWREDDSRKIPTSPNYAETVIRWQGSCPCQPVSSPWRVDIASVSGQDSPIILNTPQLPEYRVSTPSVHPEEVSSQSIPVIINCGKPQPQMKNFSNSTNSRAQDSRTNRSSPQQQIKVLFLGDAIIKGVNLRRLKSGIHKNSKSGGNRQTMIEEVRLYDLKAFFPPR